MNTIQGRATKFMMQEFRNKRLLFLANFVFGHTIRQGFFLFFVCLFVFSLIFLKAKGGGGSVSFLISLRDRKQVWYLIMKLSRTLQGFPQDRHPHVPHLLFVEKF